MKLSKSGIFLIVVLVIAIGLSAWVTVMTCNVLTKEPITTPSRASGGDTPQPVQPIEKPKEPDTLVISMGVGDCTLASIQTGRDFDSYIDKNGTSWPFSGVLEYLSKDEFTLANLECRSRTRRSSPLPCSISVGRHRMLTFSCRAAWSASRSATTTRMTSARKASRIQRRLWTRRRLLGLPAVNPRCSRPSTV